MAMAIARIVIEPRWLEDLPAWRLAAGAYY